VTEPLATTDVLRATLAETLDTIDNCRLLLECVILEQHASSVRFVVAARYPLRNSVPR
jgi:hypothetical protein